MLLKIINNIFRFIIIGISSYILMTKSFELTPYLMLFLALSLLASGLSEVISNRKRTWGYTTIIVSLFIFFVSLQSFILK
ncbi:hypothetical protein GGC63_003816 [Paenibacillus sp. OAS669]|nr:hypothetical protein [Paenibacillus sp. OAS669]